MCLKVRQRADLGSSSRVRTVNLNSDQPAGVPPTVPEENENSTPASSQNKLVIWGTDVVVSHCKTRFTEFVNRLKVFLIFMVLQNVGISKTCNCKFYLFFV